MICCSTHVQLALKLDSPSERNCSLSLLHLAAEMLCSGNLFAQSCAWLPWACWAFVNTLRTSVLSLNNLAAGAFMLLNVHEKFYWCEILTAKIFTQIMEMLILISSLCGVFSPFFYALRHPPILYSFILPSSIFLYQLKLYSLHKAFRFWQCLDIGNIEVSGQNHVLKYFCFELLTFFSFRAKYTLEFNRQLKSTILKHFPAVP